MLEKITVTDKIEVLEYGAVQVRTATRIVEDGNILSTSYHRHVIQPGEDYSQEETKVQAICSVTHTPEVVTAFAASNHITALETL